MAEREMSSPSYLKPNSHKYKEEERKKVEKIAKGKTSVQKKPFSKRFNDAFLGDDVEDVKAYLLWDVLIPAVKDTIVDLIKKGADAVFYGGPAPASNLKRNGRVTTVSYSSYANRPSRTYNRRAVHDFDNIVFSDRNDAEEILSQLVELTMNYGVASVADFYEMAGEESTFADNKYGWGELSEARVSRVREGYIVELPKPEPIDI